MKAFFRHGRANGCKLDPRIRLYRCRPSLERLPDRITPTCTTDFTNFVLTITCDDVDNLVEIDQDGSNNILLNGSTIAGNPTTDITLGIVVLGNGGNDTITIGAVSSLNTPATLDGGDGDDSLSGGNGVDVYTGGKGNDIINRPFGDLFREQADVNFTVTNKSMTGLGIDVFSNVVGLDISLTGGAGNTLIDASAYTFGQLTLVGGAGSDTLLANGQDSLNGGDGNDTLQAANGISTFTGGAGNDSIIGAFFFDMIVEQADVDFILSDTQLTGLGIDVLDGITLASLTGGAGDNVIDASGFTNGRLVTLSGLAGNDLLIGMSTGDLLKGGDGNDTLKGGQGFDTLDGGNGFDVPGDCDSNDTLLSMEVACQVGTPGDDTIDLSGSTDPVIVDGLGGNDVIIGGTDNDTLIGGDGDDSITGGGGFDCVEASADADFILTNTNLEGQGTDTLSGIEAANLTGGINDNSFTVGGFTGDATLDGGGGLNRIISTADTNFTLSGPPAPIAGTGRADGQSRALLAQSNGGKFDMVNVLEAVLTGGKSNNTFTMDGFTGAATLDGGAGKDRMIAKNAGDVVLTNELLSLSLGGEFFHQGMEQASLVGGSGNDSFDAKGFTGAATLDGGAGNDTIKGGSGADVLVGGKGNDTLVGRGGNDILRALGGSDLLNGGGGIDIVDGGGGTDRCLNAETRIGCEL